MDAPAGRVAQARRPLHAQARQLAEPGGDLVQGAGAARAAARGVLLGGGAGAAHSGVHRLLRPASGTPLCVDVHGPAAGERGPTEAETAALPTDAPHGHRVTVTARSCNTQV